MPRDTIAIGIALGVIGVLLYVPIRGWRQKSFDLAFTVLVFLAGFSIPGGVVLIAAGWTGNPEDLPFSWRQHVVVAGIVTMGLALQFLWQEALRVWPRKATPATDEKEPDSTQM